MLEQEFNLILLHRQVGQSCKIEMTSVLQPQLSLGLFDLKRAEIDICTA